MRRLTPLASALLILLLLSTTFGQNETTRRDGNWWRQQPKEVKQIYIGGLFDGMLVGYDFSYFGFIDNPRDKECLSKVENSFNGNIKKYLSNVKNEQVVDGLNDFYSDFKNRRIKTRAALFLVLQSIAGLSKEDFEKEVELQRREAAQ